MLTLFCCDLCNCLSNGIIAMMDTFDIPLGYIELQKLLYLHKMPYPVIHMFLVCFIYMPNKGHFN